MGTRADFYVGLGPDAEWLGSIAFDGHPGSVFGDDIAAEDRLFAGHGDERLWREDVAELLAHESDHSTLPDRGWPWPWEDSNTTDYAYDPDTQRVLGSSFGGFWFVVADGEPEGEDGYADNDIDRDGIGRPTFPNMKERQNVRYDKGSGAMFIGTRPDGSMGLL